MNTIISNDIKVIEYNRAILEWCEENLILPNPDFHVAQNMGRWTGNIPRNLVLFEKRGNQLVMPFGVIKSIWSIIKEKPVTTEFAPNQPLNMKGDIPLYDYQKNAVNAVIHAKNGMLEAPCGSGKTQMGIAMIKAIGLKALWLTHTTELMTQSMDRAKDYFDGDFGTITAGKVNIGKDITFATVQTMAKLDLTQYKNEFNVIVVDEAHRVAGTPTRVMQFYKVITNIAARYKFGLSATLSRADGMIKSAFAVLGPIVHRIQESEVGEKIIKATHVEIKMDTEPSEDYLDTDGTLIYNNLIDYLSFNKNRNERIVNIIAGQDMNNHSQLVLVSRVKHIKILQDMLKNLNVKSVSLSGGTNTDARKEVLDGMRTGEHKILIATIQLAKEGLDIPILDRLHLVTPSKNKAMVKQAAGRIERNVKDKPHPFIMDYVDTKIHYCVNMFKRRKTILK